MIGVISGPYFLVFRLNTEIYFVNIRIQSEYRRIQTRNKSVFGHFSRSASTIYFRHFPCLFQYFALRKKCPYSDLLWSVFSHIRTKYGQILRISPYSIRMRKNTNQNHFKYGRFLRSVGYHILKCCGVSYLSFPDIYFDEIERNKIRKKTLRNIWFYTNTVELYVGKLWEFC